MDPLESPSAAWRGLAPLGQLYPELQRGLSKRPTEAFQLLVISSGARSLLEDFLSEDIYALTPPAPMRRWVPSVEADREPYSKAARIPVYAQRVLHRLAVA